MLIFLLALIVLVLLILTGCYILFYLGVCRFPKDPPVNPPKKMQIYAGLINEGREWFSAQSPELVHIAASDGTPLAGYYLPAGNARGTLLLVHGYRSDAMYDFSTVFRFYHELGFSILSVCQRAHGRSGGNFITFGIKERYDVLDWLNYLCDRFGSEQDIFINGVSMGASTVLMAAGLELPKNVRGIIADCGYTSPYEEFREVLHHHHIPFRPAVDIANFFARTMAGFDFREYSTLQAMAVNTRPVLFVHGDTDHFVPCRFSRENYDACVAEKQLIVVPGAAHGCSYLVDTDGCQRALKTFFDKFCTGK